MFFRDADAIIFVYDATDIKSYDDVFFWFNQTQQHIT